MCGHRSVCITLLDWAAVAEFEFCTLSKQGSPSGVQSVSRSMFLNCPQLPHGVCVLAFGMGHSDEVICLGPFPECEAFCDRELLLLFLAFKPKCTLPGPGPIPLPSHPLSSETFSFRCGKLHIHKLSFFLHTKHIPTQQPILEWSHGWITPLSGCS